VLLSLLIGQSVPRPAPRLLMSALENVHINESEDFAKGFQLQFRAERDMAASQEYALLNSPLLTPGNRVVISVTLNAKPRVLMDGIITHHQLTPSGGKAGTSLTVTGEDLSVLMDMADISTQYPPLPHEAVVLIVLLKYATYGLIPIIIPSPTSWSANPLDQTPAQKETDRAYLQRLAKKHGYRFGLKPGPFPLANLAYWGPPDLISRISRICPPQKSLAVDMGPASNVESINFSYKALAAKQVHGLVMNPDFLLPVPVMTLFSTRVPPLSSRPALQPSASFVKKKRLNYKGHSIIEAWAKAQQETDDSADGVVTANGTLDALRYGDLLTAPGVVGLRGAGYSYDGYYYVKSVDHTINRNEYKQAFKLAREGTGSRTQKV
jgi:hypothetical protein